MEVKVKMYNVGELGDCFHLTFKEDNEVSHVLIDFGSFSNSKIAQEKLRNIANEINKEIKKDKKGKVNGLDVVVGTHQHNDHVSGFVHAREEIKKIGIDNVWLSWLDDPENDEAQSLAQARKSIFNNLAQLHKSISSNPEIEKTVAFQNIDSVLDYSDEALVNDLHSSPLTPQKGIDNLKEDSKNIQYLKPGAILDLPGLKKNRVKIYVLGPPKDQRLLFKNQPNKNQSYDFNLAEISNLSDILSEANTKNYNKEDIPSSERNFPFNYNLCRKTKIQFESSTINDKENKKGLKLPTSLEKFFDDKYYLQEYNWRNIDSDWLNQAGKLALYLDTYTNNSSLVLAFEIVSSKKVLLFVGDAQIGNWLSWDKIQWETHQTEKTPSMDDILKNTILYKVGHHCSHNGTLKDYLDNKMNHKDLVALIPVHKDDPHIKVRGWKMPAKNLYKKLKEKTSNRVLQMQGDYDPDCDPEGNAHSAWQNIQVIPNKGLDDSGWEIVLNL